MLRNSSSAHCLEERGSMEPVTRQNSGASGSWRGPCSSFGSYDTLGASKSTLNHIDAAVQVDTGETFSDDPGKMGKKRDDLAKIRKGTPLYSREDIREQYCINSKEIEVLERVKSRSLFGCLSTHKASPYKKKTSFLPSCVKRRASDDNLPVLHYMPQHPSQSSFAASKSSTLPPLHPTAPFMPNKPRPSTIVGLDGSLDDSLVRRRPKSFCVTDPRRFGVGTALTMPGPGFNFESRLPEGGYTSIMSLPKGSSLPVHHTTSPSVALSNTWDQNGYPVPPSYPFSYGGRLAYTQPNTPDLSTLMRRKQMQSPELLLDDRRQKHVSFDSSSPKHQSEEYANSNYSVPNLAYAGESSQHHHSHERLLDGRKSPESSYRVDPFALSPSLARAILIDKLKKASMKSQATQTDLLRRSPPLHATCSVEKVSMLSRESQAQFSDEEVFTVRRLIKSYSEVDNSHDKYETEVYEIDTPLQLTERNPTTGSDSSLSSSPVTAHPHNVPTQPFKSSSFDSNKSNMTVPNGQYVKGKRKQLLKALSEGAILLDRKRALRFASGFVDVDLDHRPAEEVSMERVVVHDGMDLSSGIDLLPAANRHRPTPIPLPELEGHPVPPLSAQSNLSYDLPSFQPLDSSDTNRSIPASDIDMDITDEYDTGDVKSPKSEMVLLRTKVPLMKTLPAQKSFDSTTSLPDQSSDLGSISQVTVLHRGASPNSSAGGNHILSDSEMDSTSPRPPPKSSSALFHLRPQANAPVSDSRSENGTTKEEKEIMLEFPPWLGDELIPAPTPFAQLLPIPQVPCTSVTPIATNSTDEAEARKSNLADAILKAHRARLTMAGLKNHPESLSETLTSPESESSESRFTEHETSKSSEPVSRTSPTSTAAVITALTDKSSEFGTSDPSNKSRARELVSESSEDFVTAASEENKSLRRTYNAFETSSSFVTACEPTISEGSRYSTLRTDFSSEDVQFASPLLDDIAETDAKSALDYELCQNQPEPKEGQTSYSNEETEESSSSGSYSLEGQNPTDITPTVEDLRISLLLENVKQDVLPLAVPILTPTEPKKPKRKIKSRSDTSDLRLLLRDMPLSTDDEMAMAGAPSNALCRTDTRHRREKFAEKTRTIDQDPIPSIPSINRVEGGCVTEFRDRLTEDERRKLKEALKLQFPSGAGTFAAPARGPVLHSATPRMPKGLAAAEKWSFSDDEEVHAVRRDTTKPNSSNATESALLMSTAEGARKRRNKTIEISMRRPAKVSDSIVASTKSRSRSPPTRRKFKTLDDPTENVETPLKEIIASKFKSSVCEELTSGMVRSPAMHEGFRVEDWSVDRTPVQTPDTPVAGDAPEFSLQYRDKFRKHKRNVSEVINPAAVAASAAELVGNNKLPSILPESDYENIEASSVLATTSIHLTRSPAYAAEEDDISLLENPTTDLGGSQPNLLAPALGTQALSCESLRSISPGSDSVFLSESLADLHKRTSRRAITHEMEDSTTTLEYVNPPEGFGDSPGTLSQSVTEDETAKTGKEEQQGSFKNKRKESGRGKRAKSCTLPLTGQDELDPPSSACHAGSSKSLEGDSTWSTHREGQKPERAVSASEMWYPETKLPALRQITLRAKSEERAREHRIERRFCPRSVESSWESFGSQKNEPPNASEDEDAGIYDAGYRNGLWMYVGETEELQVWKRIEKPAETEDATQGLKLIRTESNDSTTSERDFRRKYTAITHRMVHRKASVEMFRRLATDTFNKNSPIQEEIRHRLTLRESLEDIVHLMLIIWCREHYAIRLITGECDKTVVVKRQSGEFGFRIHGSRPVVVSAIEPGTPAETSGLEVGDIIITINDVNVLDSSHSEVVKIAHAGSDELKLEVTRTCDVFALGQKDPHDTQVVLSGYLWRQGGFTTRIGNQIEASNTVKPWYRRWFVLKQDNSLYYYKNDQMQQPLGAIVLLHYTVSLASDADRPFTFHLLKGGQCRHVLAAESEPSMHRWASAITQFGAAAVHNDVWMETCRKQVELSPNAIPNPDCLGHLMKLGHRLKAWQRRFCLLKDACLYFYGDSSAESALGLIHLHGYRIQSGSSSGNRKFAFELLPPEPRMRHFHFYTDSENERKRWIAALEYSIDRWIRLG